MWNFASVEVDFLHCHLQLSARSAGWQQLRVLWWTLLCAAVSCIQVIRPPRVHSTVLSFSIPVEELLLARIDKSRWECLSLVGDVYTWRTVFFLEQHQQSPHFSKALWSNSAVLRGIWYLKSSGSGGIESWLYSCILHCELLLAIEMTFQRETRMRDGLEERINSFPPTFQMTGLLQCSYIPYYAKLFHNTKYYSNTMCDYYNFPSLVQRYYICKHLLICCLWYSVLDRIFLCHSRSLQNFLLLCSSHQCSMCTYLCWGNPKPDWAALSLSGKIVLDALLEEMIQKDSWH